MILNGITNIVRSNQNAVMFRIGNGNSDTAIYSIFDLKEQAYTYTGSLASCKSAWNRHYANSRQFVSPNGVNHRFMNAQ